MITGDMRYYPVLGLKNDGYGYTTPDFDNIHGYVKMALYITDFNTQQNAVFSSSSYVGLASSIELPDIDILEGFENKVTVGKFIVAEVPDRLGELSVLRVNAIYRKGRYYQIFTQLSGHDVPDDFLQSEA